MTNAVRPAPIAPAPPAEGPPEPSLVALVEALARWRARKDYAARAQDPPKAA
jgi:hypothetical protein